MESERAMRAAVIERQTTHKQRPYCWGSGPSVRHVPTKMRQSINQSENERPANDEHINL